MFKEIFIPVAAFAVTATGVSAFNADVLDKLDIDLSDTQISALEEAHELKQSGADRSEVFEILDEAGIDKETLKEIKTAAKEHRQANREAVREALENNDYDAYLEVVAGSPRADLIDSTDDFEKLVEAYELREAGDKEAAREIMEELGFERPEGKDRGHRGGDRGQGAE